METTVIIHAEEPILNIILPVIEEEEQEAFDYMLDLVLA